MNAERLLRLADLLEADAAAEMGIKFDLGEWGFPSGGRSEFEGGEPEVNCNTTACAFGLACISGLFKDDGLDFAMANAWSNNRLQIVPVLSYADGSVLRTIEGEQAGCRLFDISERAFHRLFMGDYYAPAHRQGAAGELAVAERVRAFVASDGDVAGYKQWNA